MPNDEKIALARELLAGLSSEQRAALREMVRVRTQGPSDTPRSILAAAHLGGAQPVGQAREEFEQGEAAGALAVPEVASYAAGGPGLARGIAGVATKGVPALSRAALRQLARVGVYAGVGGTITASPLPVVGGHGFKEGATLGAMMGLGQGGAGALWKHGKKKALIERVSKWILGRDKADDVVEAVVESVPRGMSSTQGRATVIPMPTRPVPMSAPAPAGVAAPAAVPAGAMARIKAANAAAKAFGIKAGAKVHGISVDGNVIKWFPTPDKAKGAIAKLARANKWKRVDVGKYKTPEGNIVQLDWTEATRGGVGKAAKVVSTVPRPVRAATTSKAYVDRAVREAQEQFKDLIRRLEEVGNLKTVKQSRRPSKSGYQNRDIVDDYVSGVDIDMNAEYVLDHSKLKLFMKRLRERVEREIAEEVAAGGPG